MAGGNFKCSLKLIKVECLIKPVTEYPIVQSLNMIYDVFNSPKRRLIILSQLLMYFYYIENNPKEMMRYLKLYMDQDIDDTIKLQNLMVISYKKKQCFNIIIFKQTVLIINYVVIS